MNQYRYEKQALTSIKRSRREHILQWWRESIGERLIGDVTPALIVECREKLATESTHQGKKRAPATIVSYLASLSLVFSVASREWQWIESNPVAKVSKPSLPRGRTRFLDEDERDRLLQACQESSNSLLYTITVIALSTGMRRNEILSLKWNDIDFVRGRLTLQETKNGDCRVVPLAGHALELVRELEDKRRVDSELLFPSKNPSKPIDFRSAWRVAVKNAGIKDFRFHDTRHCCASYLLMNGASLAEVGEVLGHRNVQTSKRYSHLSDSHRFNLVSSMNEKIFG